VYFIKEITWRSLKLGVKPQSDNVSVRTVFNITCTMDQLQWTSSNLNYWFTTSSIIIVKLIDFLFIDATKACLQKFKNQNETSPKLPHFHTTLLKIVCNSAKKCLKIYVQNRSQYFSKVVSITIRFQYQLLTNIDIVLVMKGMQLSWYKLLFKWITTHILGFTIWPCWCWRLSLNDSTLTVSYYPKFIY